MDKNKCPNQETQNTFGKYYYIGISLQKILYKIVTIMV